MKRLTVLILILIFFSFTGYSKVWTISNAALDVKFDDQSLSLTVTDKRCNKLWEQVPFKDNFKVVKVTQKGNSLDLILTGSLKLGLNISLSSGSDIIFTLSADPKAELKELAFPAPFKTPDKNHYLLCTDGEGLLLQVDDKEYPLGDCMTYFCDSGLSMAWMGVTDDKFETGYMAILETPFDAEIRTKREGSLITFSPVWLASKEHFGYDRKVIYSFFAKGGYVAQCKKYREYIWKKNNVITLRENQMKTPAIGKMIGSVHMYVWDNARDVSFAKDLKQAGIEKAFFLWDPNHNPYPENDYDNRLKELGYVSGVYDLYTDSHPGDSIARPSSNQTTGTWLSRGSYPGLFKEITARKKDGKYYSNSFGTYNCPLAIRPEIIKRVEKELPVYPHESYFLDVYQANGLYECYSDKHPLTRQGYAEEIINNYKLLVEKYKTFVGGEWGADFVGSNSVYVHGMMTLKRTWSESEINKRGTIYYYGDWRNNPRPSIMISTNVATDKYLKYSINEYTRVPLYELVYHDAVVTSWRWEDGNSHIPEIWWKKDLFNILYGSAPLWCLDRDRWEAFKNTFIQSYKNICPWLQQIGYDEMINHRFITNDHKIQESVFSSGKRVIVNFGDSDYLFEGKVIKAKGYITAPN